MLPGGDKPILRHIMEGFAAGGVKEFVLWRTRPERPSAAGGWWRGTRTPGPMTPDEDKALEAELARWYAVPHASLVNSGGSANLLAVAALANHPDRARRLLEGYEVIAVAAGAPITVAPLIQHGLVPVFLDISIPTYELDVAWLEQARSPATRAVMVTHALGNPVDLDAVVAFCRKYGLFLIEDNGDASGSLYRGRKTGTFGDLATLAMGGGGAVLCKDDALREVVEGLRARGRTGDQYRYFGYDVEVTDPQAAVGLAWVGKLDASGAARRRHWSFFREALRDLEDVLILPEPTPGADPNWSGFVMTVRDGAPFSRDDVVRHLESRKIQARVPFAGNLVRQPAMTELAETQKLRSMPAPYRVANTLVNTDRVMERSFCVDLSPGLTEEQRASVAQEVRAAVLR
jgi:CDP-4-dehydro-6-deoxyglucose reductase, E1